MFKRLGIFLKISFLAASFVGRVFLRSTFGHPIPGTDLNLSANSWTSSTIASTLGDPLEAGFRLVGDEGQPADLQKISWKSHLPGEISRWRMSMG